MNYLFVTAWEEQSYIRKALDQLELVSCLTFVQRTDEDDYIAITVTITFKVTTKISSH